MREEDIDDKKMPLLDHLVELRNRLMWSVGAILVAFIVCYHFSGDIYGFLTRPLADALGDREGRRMIFTDLTEAFFTYIKVAFWAAALLSFPIIASQVWMFVAPGLYKHERKAFLPFLLATPVLFFMGGALVYYFIFPLAWRFFLSFETPVPRRPADPARGQGQRVPVARHDHDLRLRARLPAAGAADPAGPGRHPQAPMLARDGATPSSPSSSSPPSSRRPT
jgi:hypothetical protein